MRHYKITQCEICGTDIPATSRGKYCKTCCRAVKNAANKKRFQANFDAGLCRCGRARTTPTNCDICHANRKRNAPKYLPQKRLKDTERRDAIKAKVFDYYGNCCACCEETEFAFLSIDHIGGWGKNHLKPDGNRYGGQALYQWIVKNNFPKGFRILCGSCHYAVSYYGYCPHELKRGLERHNVTIE